MPLPHPHIVLLTPLGAGELVWEWSLALKQKGESLEGLGWRLGLRLAWGTEAEAEAEAEAGVGMG